MKDSTRSTSTGTYPLGKSSRSGGTHGRNRAESDSRRYASGLVETELKELMQLFPNVPESSLKWLLYENAKRELRKMNLTAEEYEGRIDVILDELNL